VTQLDVDPELFYDLSGQYSRASRATSAALRVMDQELRGAVKMSGQDEDGKLWGRGYFVSGIEAVVTAGKANDVLAKMAGLVRQTGVNHDQSEDAESYNSTGALPPQDPGAVTFTARPLKNPAEGTRKEPAGWAVVMGSTTWINGNPELMHKAATSWQTAAGIYTTQDTELRAKMSNLSGSSTPELPDIQDTHNAILDGVEILGDAMRQQAGATGGYADVLKAAQEGAEWELQLQTVAQAINTVNAATVGRPIQRAILEAAEIEIEHSRRKIQDMLKGLADARQISVMTFTAVSNSVTTVMTTKFQPVLDKQLKNPPPRTRADQARRNKLEGAKAEARAGIDPTKTKESIKSASGTATKRVPDDLDRTNMRLTEVKNVQRQALTTQIQDDLAYCEANGYEFVLITDNATTLTPDLQALVNQGKIKHVRMDFQS
jgi:hypothetical protein